MLLEDRARSLLRNSGIRWGGGAAIIAQVGKVARMRLGKVTTEYYGKQRVSNDHKTLDTTNPCATKERDKASANALDKESIYTGDRVMPLDLQSAIN